MDNLSGKVDGVSSLTADEWNQLATECNNLIAATGQAPTSSSLVQILRSMTEYGVSGTFFNASSGNGQDYDLDTSFASGTEITSYKNGMSFTFFVPVTNASTVVNINVNSLGYKSVVLRGGSAISANSLVVGNLIGVVYSSSADRFEVISGLESSDSVANNSTVSGATVTEALDTLAAGVGIGSGSVQYSSVGAHQFVVPVGGYSRVKVSMVGAGGGGGGNASGELFGGGSGAYCVYDASGVAAGVTFDINIGAGGTGAAAAATAGGDTTMTAPVSITAGGGTPSSGVGFPSGGGQPSGALTYGITGCSSENSIGAPSFFGGGSVGENGQLGSGGPSFSGAHFDGGDGFAIIEYWV